VHYGQVTPRKDIDVWMVAPKAPGHTVRSTYVAGGGTPCLVAVYQNPSKKARDMAISYASAIGGGKAGIIETNFKEETETDLFGEQAVLCGGSVELVKAGFDTLVEAGLRAGDGLLRVPARAEADRRPDVRGRHRHHELLDLEQRRVWRVRERPEGHRRGHAPAHEGDPRRIQSGDYAKEFVLENRAGAPTLLSRRRQTAELPIEKVGGRLREMMPWIRKNRLVDQSKN
jgi:ketol-acid reductoisomerase